MQAAGYYLGKPRVLMVMAAAVVAAGMALNWDRLVAAGIAPILIAVLPCAVMCALGLYMHKAAGGSGDCCTGSSAPKTVADNKAANAQPSRPSISPAALDCCQEADMSAPDVADKAPTRETERGVGA